LARQIGGSHLGPKFGFPLLLTHEEIASMVCSTRETVTRTLSQFRKDGWISVEGSEVAIHQPELLRASV
jgi:CRP/FNR family transcriptional regulator